MTSKKNKDEGSPNLKKWLVGTGLGTVANAGTIGAHATAGHFAGAEDALGGEGLFNKLKSEAKIPIFETKEGPLQSMFAPRRLPNQGTEFPNSPHVIVGSKAPSVLSHELGHGDLHHHPLGRMLQNRGTMLAGGLSPLLAPLGGMAAGLGTDNENVHRAAIAAPVLGTLPMLGYEAAASIAGLRKLRAAGASKSQITAAMKTLAPAWGSYAMRAGGGAASAYAGLGVGGALRRKFKEAGEEKQAMDDVAMKAFVDELHKIGGFLDAAKNILTTPIPGTPDLLGGVKSGIEKATRGGMPGKGGPSAGFQKFQQQRAAAASMPKHAAGTLGPQGINAAVRAGGLGLTRKNVLGAMMHPGVSPDMVSSIHRAAMTPSAAGPLNEAFAGHVKSMFQAGVR